MNEATYCKVVDVTDFEDPGLVPFLRFIAQDEMVRFGLDEPIIRQDSKQWACAMMLRTFAETGILTPGALFAGIGAGAEQTSFALAAKGGIVFPTDRYLDRASGSDVAPAAMMVDPDSFTTFAYPRGAVIPVHTDARALRLPSDTFNGVYSSDSIETFGSLDAVAAAAEEIGRILKPGGIATISTKFRLEGPNDRTWFDDSCILFTPELIERYILIPSGLQPIGEMQFSPSNRTYDGRTVLMDFMDKTNGIKTLAHKQNSYPNLVLNHEGFLFCSVHLALRKPSNAASTSAGARSHQFRVNVEAETTRAARALSEGLYGPPVGVLPVAQSLAVEAQRVARLEAELYVLRNSRSFRLTSPMRDLAHYVRTKPTLHRVAKSTARVVRSLRNQFRRLNPPNTPP